MSGWSISGLLTKYQFNVVTSTLCCYVYCWTCNIFQQNYNIKKIIWKYKVNCSLVCRTFNLVKLRKKVMLQISQADISLSSEDHVHHLGESISLSNNRLTKQVIKTADVLTTELTVWAASSLDFSPEVHIPSAKTPGTTKINSRL